MALSEWPHTGNIDLKEMYVVVCINDADNKHPTVPQMNQYTDENADVLFGIDNAMVELQHNRKYYPERTFVLYKLVPQTEPDLSAT